MIYIGTRSIKLWRPKTLQLNASSEVEQQTNYITDSQPAAFPMERSR